MYRSYAYAFIILFTFIALIGCKKDDDNPVGPITIAREEWDVVLNNDSSNYGHETLQKKSDGSVDVEGSWTFTNQSAVLQCSFAGGTVDISDTTISLTVQGTATYTGAPPGYQNSAFTLTAPGNAHNGKWQGSYSISYAAYGWPSSILGTFTAIRIEGSGITN